VRSTEEIGYIHGGGFYPSEPLVMNEGKPFGRGPIQSATFSFDAETVNDAVLLKNSP